MKMHPIVKIILLFLLLLVAVYFGIFTIVFINEEDFIAAIVFLFIFLVIIGFSIFPLIKSFEQLKKISLRKRSIRHKNRSIRYKEKCFKKIDDLHRYCESGSITQEEFETIKQEILSSIE